MQLTDYRCPFSARRVDLNAKVKRDATVSVIVSCSSELVKEEADKFKTGFSSKTLQLKCLNKVFSLAFVCIVYAGQTIFPA